MAVIDKIKNALHKDENVHSAAPDETGLSRDPPPTDPTSLDQVAFDDKLVTVIFVLGGPGAGTSTSVAFLKRLHRDNGADEIRKGHTVRATRSRLWLQTPLR